MAEIVDNDRVEAERLIREAIVGRLEGETDVHNVQGRERRPEQDEDLEETVTIPDPVTGQPILSTVFVKWVGFDDRQDVNDDEVTTLILRYNIAVVDEFVDKRKDGSDSETDHKRRVLRIGAALKGDRHLGYDPTQVTHTLPKMPADTQLIEDDEGGSTHLSVLTLAVEIVGFKG